MSESQTLQAIWTLASFQGDLEFEILQPTTLVGRAANSSIKLADSSVSNLHAEVILRDGELWVRDMSSTNGTFVNAERLDEDRQLRDGDTVHFARVAFEARNVAISPVENTTEDSMELAALKLEIANHRRG